MPNPMHPANLPFTRNPGGCNGGNCVDAQVIDAGVLVTSTIPGNTGAVTFTHDEWAAFIPAVKAGQWDHTLIGAPVAA